MIIIETKNQTHNFICAIFDNAEVAFRAYEKLSQKENFILIEKELKFPFFIIERGNKFEYYQEFEEILPKIRQIDTSNDDNEDIVYFNLYEITQVYQPSNIEIDSMGLLPHTHFDKIQIKKTLSQSSRAS